MHFEGDGISVEKMLIQNHIFSTEIPEGRKEGWKFLIRRPDIVKKRCNYFQRIKKIQVR
jgi:hypothetical protein